MRPARCRLAARLCALAVPALAALLGASCADSLFVDPAPAGSEARVALAVSVAPQGGSSDAFARADQLHLRLVRSTGAALADTLVPLANAGAEIAVDLPIRLDGESETLAISADMLWEGQTLFRGTGSVTLERGHTTPAEISLVPVPANVNVPPFLPTLTAIGDTLRLSGAVVFATGDTITGASLAWSTPDASIVQVSADGLVRALAEGVARIVGSYQSFQRTITLLVQAVVTRVDVSPTSLTIFVDSAGQLSAVARDRNGNALVRTLGWTSANPSVAVIDAAGRVTGVAPGETTVAASVEGVSSAPVRVLVQRLPVASVTVSPASATLGLGDTLRLTATPRDAAGKPLLDRAVTWSSADPQVATVDSTGLVRALTTGTATISAVSEVRSGSATITVAPPVIRLSPVAVSFQSEPEVDPDPNFVDVSVTNGGPGRLSGLSVDAVLYDSTASGWISATLADSIAPTTLRVLVSTGNLLQGTHSAFVVVRSSVPGVAPQLLAVTATVQFTATFSTGPRAEARRSVVTVKPAGDGPPR